MRSQISSFARRDALALGQVGRGSDARRGGIAGIAKEVLHRSSLHGGVGPPRALGILVALEVAIIDGIGVDDDAGGSVLCRHEWLYAAEVLAIAHQDQLSFQVDAQLFQLLEIFRPAIIGVDNLGGHITRS